MQVPWHLYCHGGPFRCSSLQKRVDPPDFFVDYCSLNRKMKPDKRPLPRVEEVLADSSGSKWFTNLGLFSGYWKIRLANGVKQKTKFICRYVTYQFEVMPFGLMNAPSIFQQMMDAICQSIRFVQAYLDDFVVFSPTLEKHKEHELEVFNHAVRAGLKLKVKKCIFAK